MVNIIVSRHPGAIAWLRSRGIDGQVVAQISPDAREVEAGSVVYGSLPLELVDKILAKGAKFVNISLPAVAFGQRGSELTPDEMAKAGAKLLEVVSLQLREVEY